MPMYNLNEQEKGKPMSYTYTAPKPFEGTVNERWANYETHNFTGIDERCVRCDRKPVHIGAAYPCGAEVPRIEVEVK